ncbi:MAG: DNA polymerase I [Clostridia bacterium]|nr:DNA polymerase I [Clostridia bacterium]
MDKFIIVDGNSLANRAFYAMPYLTNRNKQPSGAVFGFANILTKLIAEQKPKYLAVAFDHARKTFRNEIFADYKGTRKETPDDLRRQFPVIKQMLEIMGIKVFEFAGIEADDIIGTVAKQSGQKNVLVSGDRDLLQLIDENTNVWLTKKGVSDIEVYDETVLKEKFGFAPSGIIDLKALMGDSSDNIPGVAGVGEKTALSLLDSYVDLDGVYQNIGKINGKLKEKLIADIENAYMSRTLATIKTDCDFKFDLQECVFDFPFGQQVRNFFEDWDFRVLIKRQELYAYGVGERQADAKKILVENLQMVESLKEKVKSFFAYDFASLEFSVGNGEIYYIKKDIDLFSETVDVSDVVKQLKPVFEDENIEKITTNSKDDMKILKKFGVSLNNFFDIDIARYVLFAGLPKMPVPFVCDYLAEKKELEQKMIDAGVEKVYQQIEIPLVKVLREMEDEGFKVDAQTLDQLSEKYVKELNELTEKIFTLAGQSFNLNSPKQVAGILFEKLGLVSYNNKKQSTSFSVLDEMRGQHEIVDAIIEYRKVSKLVSTYINVYKSICAKDGDIVHTIFNQTLTSTGRLSSSEPNMQNIPTRNEEGKNLRKIFISKYENGQIISADYSQIELRLLANLANETGMIEAYKNGVDIHTKTASEIFKVPVEKVTQEQRRDAKAVNFGIIYGISDFGLSQNIKTSKAKAKEYIDSYFDRYPKIKEFMDANIKFAKEKGFVKSYFDRIRHIPEISSSNYNLVKFGERVAMNMPLQGTASDVIKFAMVEVQKKLQGMKSHLILQVHDELIVDAVEQEVEKVKEILKETMEGVCKFEVPLTVSVSNGKNLFECK